MAPPLPPPIIRVLYRSLLRASRYGRHPEVFGPHGAQVAAAATAANRESSYSDTFTVRGSSELPGVARNVDFLHFLVIPSTPREVRSLLGSAFRPPRSHGDGDDRRETSGRGSHASRVVREGDGPAAGPPTGTSMDSFAALRGANEASSILCPRPSSLPSTLPIFDYPAAALLPGEETSFNFFEPRYLLLVDIATDNERGGGGGGYFLLRARAGRGPIGGSVLVKIVERAPLPNGNVAVRCVGGPRVAVVEEDEVEIDSWAAVSGVVDDEDTIGEGGNPPPPLARATEFHLTRDDDEEGGCSDPTDDDLARTRSRILDLIASLTDLGTVILRGGGGGLPPVDPEFFSFWALRFVLSPGDVASKLRWLYGCRDSGERMGYVEDFLRRHLEVRERDRRRSETEGEVGDDTGV